MRPTLDQTERPVDTDAHLTGTQPRWAGKDVGSQLRSQPHCLASTERPSGAAGRGLGQTAQFTPRIMLAECGVQGVGDEGKRTCACFTLTWSPWRAVWCRAFGWVWGAASSCPVLGGAAQAAATGLMSGAARRTCDQRLVHAQGNDMRRQQGAQKHQGGEEASVLGDSGLSGPNALSKAVSLGFKVLLTPSLSSGNT